jgi:hypothetical protein
MFIKVKHWTSVFCTSSKRRRCVSWLIFGGACSWRMCFGKAVQYNFSDLLFKLWSFSFHLIQSCWKQIRFMCCLTNHRKQYESYSFLIHYHWSKLNIFLLLYNNVEGVSTPHQLLCINIRNTVEANNSITLILMNFVLPVNKFFKSDWHLTHCMLTRICWYWITKNTQDLSFGTGIIFQNKDSVRQIQTDTFPFS